MNHTPAFHLSQWDPTDRIFMRDFNSDNAIIDAALSTRPELVEFLNVTETLNGEPGWYVPVDGKALGKCFAFFMEYRFPSGNHGGYTLTVGGSGLASYGTLHNAVSSLCVFPLRNPQTCINFLPAGGVQANLTANDATFANLTSFNIKPYSGTMTGTFSLRILAIL